MKKLISIIIPVYNSENYLKKCIDSVLSQTYKDIEVIIVNDGSKDSSDKICKNYADQDSRIKYYSQKNSGVSVTRNNGIKYSSGAYIAFLDSDDYIESNFCEIMLRELEKESSDMCICRNYDVKFLSDNREKVIKKNLKNQGTFSIKSEEYDFYSIYSHWTVWGVLYKKELLKDIFFDSDLYVGEDTLFFSKAVKKATKITFIDDFLLYYLMLENSACHGEFNLKKFTELESWQKIIEYYSDRESQSENIKAAYCLRCIEILKKCFYVDIKNLFGKDIRSCINTTIKGYRAYYKYIKKREIGDKNFYLLFKYTIIYFLPRFSSWVYCVAKKIYRKIR